ncbi:glutamate 5-kinase [Nitrosomonas sp.]|uniref:glutamate 5-kinase n=1 Tax=Nitrosomonas sp. TaxID=42353 RepID=UPI001E1A4727|nr:glutamate 5-kinase [Nitrosomonas sp.]MCB1947960.1 glutamate 5-kinase [Nitrosomonas sp.]MCP5242965.1 glutamate 5-kinase [Burkholderiales bacterium]MDR4514491.1 glutamate 5-kinase [Nitrosomonas sp.]
MLKTARRIVTKVGSSLVTNQGQGLDHAALQGWAEQIARLKHMDKEVVLVSSGAIAEGMQRLGWNTRPTALYELQAAAAVGQMGLAQAYAACFDHHELKTAQILLTHGDLSNRERYLNARSTLTTLLKLDIIPVINENDTIVTDEIRFGDNDTLAALVTNLIEADALVILTDQAGLYTSDPRKNHDATFLSEVSVADPALLKMAGGVGSSIGSGGMLTKVMAAKRAARSGAHTIIASGHEKDVLVRLAHGEAIGTRLLATIPVLAARKQWLADYLQVRGTVTLDQGAVNALVIDGKSLLPIGVTGVAGDFERGEAVVCLTQEGREIARGLINYNAAETRKIMGKASTHIATILGYVDEAELIHRNNLALL